MNFASHGFRAVCIKDSRDRKLEILCVKNLGSSKNSEEDVTTEDTETPSAARKAADEDCALRRKPPLILGTTKDGWNYFGWKVRRPLFGNRLPCRTKCGSVYSVVPAPTKIFEVPKPMGW